MNEQNNDKFIQMNITVEELSKLFGVARPSLSRAFSELENEGIICKNGNRVNIIDKKSMKFNF
jgi:DNA-binding GntR family transcriptional regulator